MDFLIGLIALLLIGFIMLSLYLGIINAGAGLAKEIIKAAIRESRDNPSDWDDIK